MINICVACEHVKLKQNRYCEMCIGNPKLVDNFKQKKPTKIKVYSNGVSFVRDERDKRRKL